MTAFESFYMFVLCPCVCMDVAFSLNWYKRIPLESSAVHKLYDTTRGFSRLFFFFFFFGYCVENPKSNVMIFLEKLDWEGVGAVCSVLGMLKPKPRYALSELSVLPLCVVFVCLASFLTCWCCLVSFKQRNLTILSSCVPLGFQRSTVC